MVRLEKPGRIIFQPTIDNSDKLRMLSEKHHMSISQLLNHIIDQVDADNTKISIAFKE